MKHYELTETEQRRFDVIRGVHERDECAQGTGRCFFPYFHAMYEAWDERETLRAALNEKVQHELDAHQPHVHDPRKDVLYERDRALNDPPANLTYRPVPAEEFGR